MKSTETLPDISGAYPKEMPADYLRIFQILDGYREGRIDFQETFFC